MTISTIFKRDGRKIQYSRQNIATAVWKSLFAVQKSGRKMEEGIRSASSGRVGQKVGQMAAELIITEKSLDKKSKLWNESKRLSEIVEQILIKSNGTHIWKVEEIQDVVEQVLLAAGHRDAAGAYILYRNKKQETRQKLAYLGGQARNTAENLGMSENAVAAMAKRYLWKDKEGKVIETPKQAMARVADCVSNSENQKSKIKNQKYWKDKYLEIMTSFEFVPGGCYFRGAGNKQNGSLANCFVLPVEDSIEKIFDAVKWAAQIHQMGGGTGFNFSHLRPRGDLVRSGGLSSGPINFMKAFDAETQIVMQGGVHRGANMGILNVDHPDIFEFIRAKSVDGEISNFNISVGAFDRFMKAVKEGKDWELVNPRDKIPVQKIQARSLWNEMVSLAYSTGDPGMVFLDAVNRFNPVLKSLGPIESTNVCGEQPLHPFDVCNLGSINLAKFVIKPWWKQNSKFKTQNSKLQFKVQNFQTNINWQRLEKVVRTSVRFLDDGIDASTYPIPQISDMAHRLRRIGLGVMGWADMLVKLGVRYDSDEGIKLAELIMKFIQEISWDESQRLAKEKGEFPLWKDSYFKTKVRNVAMTTIAPTGTISMIADCSSGIEPYFALEYTKNVVEKGGLKYTNKYYEEAKKALSVLGSRFPVIGSRSAGYQSVGRKPTNRKPVNLKLKTENGKLITEIFRTAHQISPDWHVKMQAAFQKYTDNAVSKTINFPKEAAVSDIEKAYMLAWELGCKGITVYRDGSREGQILEVKEEGRGKKEEGKTDNNLAQSQMKITPLSQRAYQVERRKITEDLADGHCPECGSLMEESEGCSLCRNCGFSKCSL
ncbi:adenosylcobalamin-dependent ribonucleoside-diphosphate reductase [Candidatus Collierbacteria bacterium]|nr:adenosylcobalamin-dependent ribonucleoside-diphosphate reductase [Candidatus Collierbacteria bacterium]